MTNGTKQEAVFVRQSKENNFIIVSVDENLVGYFEISKSFDDSERKKKTFCMV